MITNKFVSQRVPENSLNHHHHHHEDGKRQGRQKVPLFVERDKNGPHFVGRSEKDVPRFKENVNKANPFIRDTGHSEKEGRRSNVIPSQRSKLRDRGVNKAKKARNGERDKKRGRSRNQFNSKKSEEESVQRGRKEDLKRQEVERQATKGGKSKFVTKKGRRRSKKQVAGPLSASDLWSLNR